MPPPNLPERREVAREEVYPANLTETTKTRSKTMYQNQLVGGEKESRGRERKTGEEGRWEKQLGEPFEYPGGRN